jgi:hypothetical protein
MMAELKAFPLEVFSGCFQKLLNDSTHIQVGGDYFEWK